MLRNLRAPTSEKFWSENDSGRSHSFIKIFKNELKLENSKCRLHSRSSVTIPIIRCEDNPERR